MDRGSMPWLLASESESDSPSPFGFIVVADRSDDRIKLPSDPSRTVKGVDVLPFVMSPLMGPEEYEMDVSLTSTDSQHTCADSIRKWTNYPQPYNS